MSEQRIESSEQNETHWTGQQRFRYFVSAVLLPLVAILSAYTAFKTHARLGAITEVGITIAILTSWNEKEYWVAMLVHACTSAAMIQCCLSAKMAVPWHIRCTLWIAAILWTVVASVVLLKFGLQSIGAAIIAATLLAAFTLMCAVLVPTETDAERQNVSGGRFTILHLMLVTTVVAVLAAVGMQFSRTASVELWVVGKLAGALFRVFVLGCPILACYAYGRAVIDFRPKIHRFRSR